MVNKETILIEGDKKRVWPSKGDVFYFKTSGLKYYFGQVFSDKMSIGPFKNALIVCVFNLSSDSVPTEPCLSGSSLLIPPVITDNSCWKNGVFHTVSSQMVDESLLKKFLFVNPLNNKAYGLSDGIYEGERNEMILGERSLWFHSEIIKKIEGALN
ncbi:Imm26 family immunity protein [Yersinia aldovae]|uniref:Uncharacterized protein n=1 Tax=Yersinia aldovae TaxID=29483 RepID=A0ABM9SZX8_YERAL|nr:Imm26 family immunity protein [Yersinia aldovae]CNL85661.1 Uncharacterised protein [Yersinia aldovae]